MLVPCWSQGCWVRQTPGWGSQPAESRRCCCVTLGYSCTHSPAPLCNSAEGSLGRYSSPSCKLLPISSSLSSAPGGPFGSLGNEDHTRQWRWSASSVPSPYPRTRCAKTPSFSTNQGHLPTCLELRGADRATWGQYEGNTRPFPVR